MLKEEEMKTSTWLSILMAIAGDRSFTMGADGSPLFEIKELIDTISASGVYTSLGLPSGYYSDNIHILSVQIFDGSNTWIFPGNPDSTYSYGCKTNGSYIIIKHPDTSIFHGHVVKALVMKMPFPY
jgi:hypothetical protein